MGFLGEEVAFFFVVAEGYMILILNEPRLSPVYRIIIRRVKNLKLLVSRPFLLVGLHLDVDIHIFLLFFLLSL